MDSTTRLRIHAHSGQLLDSYVARWLDGPALVKTSNSFLGHVLIEHTARGGRRGWLFGEASQAVQAVSPDTVLCYDLPLARRHIIGTYGHPPAGLRPTQYTKVSGVWVSRLRGDGDAFIYVPVGDVVAHCGGKRIRVPMLDVLTQLCKTARNNHQPDYVRLAALDRLERFVA